MNYIIENDNVYFVSEKESYHVGTVNKTDEKRVDDNTVEDITYQFVISADGNQGEYVEQSRTQRTEPLPPPEPTIDDKINLLSEQVNPKNADEIYKNLDIMTKTLDELKVKKKDQLNFLCNSTILAGFTSAAIGATPNTYDFDYEGQINLAGMLNAIANNMVTEPITWKASGIPQPHTIEQFKTVYADGLTHKNSIIQRYWDLKTQVENCATKEDVNNVIW